MMKNKCLVNRQLIYKSVNRRPYGVRLTFALEENRSFTFDGPCTLLVDKDVIVEVKPIENDYRFRGASLQVSVDGFATAGEAEQIGLKFALGLLWSAVSKSYSARLIYNTPLPCSVYDRTASRGLRLGMHATVSVMHSLDTIIGPINEILTSDKPADQKLLVALELFASAKLETTERSRFVGLVSSIEPLASQEVYEQEELNMLINEFKKRIEDSSIDDSLKNSLKGRLDQLRVESVSRAIRRMVKSKLPGDKDSLQIIEDAYGLRSKILHEGATDADLEQKAMEVELIIKRLIELHIHEHLSSKV